MIPPRLARLAAVGLSTIIPCHAPPVETAATVNMQHADTLPWTPMLPRLTELYGSFQAPEKAVQAALDLHLPVDAWGPEAIPAPPDAAPAPKSLLPAPDTPPQLRLRTPIPYPAASRHAGEEGAVVVRVMIGVGGSVSNALVLGTSYSPELDAAAREGVLPWMFVPATRGGVTVTSRYDVTIKFRLREEQDELRGRGVPPPTVQRRTSGSGQKADRRLPGGGRGDGRT